MTQSWDDGTAWDSGATWDANYTSLVTSEHQKPIFLAIISTLTQGYVDAQNVLASMPGLFDVDDAVGQQLDIVGEWVGVSRNLSVPLTGVYFSFDIAGVGFDQGTWHGPFDPDTTLDALPDDSYRQLIYAKIANNQWDGTIPGAYEFMDKVFPGNVFFIQDNQDMSMLMGVTGSQPLNAVSSALLTGGYLDIKPAGVRINGYVTPSVYSQPFFGFDSENTMVSGFDEGAFAILTGGN